MTRRAETFVVDGYNLMNRLLSPRELAAGLESSRRMLESKLRAVRAVRGRGTRIILVYDGASGYAGSGEREKGFEVRYSRPPRTADDVILDLCRAMEGKPGIHVVTSDFNDIGERIRNLRLTHWTAEEFARFAEKHPRDSSLRSVGNADPDLEEDAVSKPNQLSRSEVDNWIRKFGFED